MEKEFIRKVTNRTWEEKKALCEEWKKSVKTKSKFCKEHAIPLATFFPWCNRLWPVTKKERSNIVPVKIKSTNLPFLEVSSEQTPIELILVNGATVRFKLTIKNLVPFIQELSHAITNYTVIKFGCLGSQLISDDQLMG